MITISKQILEKYDETQIGFLWIIIIIVIMN